MTILKRCPECDGTGLKDMWGCLTTCPNCGGRGRYPDGQEDEENDQRKEYCEDEFDR